MTPIHRKPRPAIASPRWGLVCLLALALAACGGARDDTTATGPAGAQAQAAPPQALFQQAAALNATELARAAQAPIPAAPSSSKKTSRVAKVANRFPDATRVAVVRFYVAAKGVHFYTAEPAETQNLRTLAAYTEEGAAFQVSSTAATGLSPVHRFFNTVSSTHLYTISEAEKAFIQERIPSLKYEGVAFYASQVADTGLVAVRRFYNPSAVSHFYTVSDSEAQSLRERMPQHQDEGVAYYVLANNQPIEPIVPAPSLYRLPHSGVTAAQCFQSGSNANALIACSDANAIALNAQQDGHRVAINPMTYSDVANPAGGNFVRTDCVKDEMTGLMWEGKSAPGNGLRAADFVFTHYTDPTQPQKWDGSAYVNPTQTDIDDLSNSQGYVNHVNAIALCGHTDWRLPTADELQSIVDYGVDNPDPTVNAAWFPNTQDWGYWSSSPYVGDAAGAWFVEFRDGVVDGANRGSFYAVRLVRAGW